MRIDRKRVPRHAVAARTQAADAKPHHIAAHAGAVVDARPAGATHLPAAEFGLELLGEIERDRSRRAGDGAANCRACMLKEGVGLGAVEQPTMVSKSSASLRLRMSVPYSFRCRGWPEQRLPLNRIRVYRDRCNVSYGYVVVAAWFAHAP